MAGYVIHKMSRLPGPKSYDGVSCILAVVVGGQVYTTAEDAEIDAEKLRKVNPVGWIVSPAASREDR